MKPAKARTLLALWTLAAGLATFATIPALGQPVYVPAGPALREIDPATGDSQIIGPFGREVSHLATAPNGVLFGYSPQVAELLTVDPSTGAATPIGFLNLSIYRQFHDLTFDACGNLWASIDFHSNPPTVPESELHRVDPASGENVLVGDLPWSVTSLVAVGSELFGVAKLVNSYWVASIDTSEPAASERLYELPGYLPLDLESDPSSRIWFLRELLVGPGFSQLDQIDLASGQVQPGVTLDGSYPGLTVGPPAGSCGADPLPIPTLSTTSLAALALALAAAALAMTRKSP